MKRKKIRSPPKRIIVRSQERWEGKREKGGSTKFFFPLCFNGGGEKEEGKKGERSHPFF